MKRIFIGAVAVASLVISAPSATMADAQADAGARTVVQATLRSSDRVASLSFGDITHAYVNTAATTRTGVSGCVSVSQKMTSTIYIPGYGMYTYLYWSTVEGACGKATITVDPLGDVTKITGSLRSYYDKKTIKLDVTLRGSTPFLPYTSGYAPNGFEFYPGSTDAAEVGVDMIAGVRREAVATGSVTSDRVKVSKKSGTGYLFRGASVGAVVRN